MFVVKKHGQYKTNSCQWVPLERQDVIQWYDDWLPASQDAHKLGASVVSAKEIIAVLIDIIERIKCGDVRSITEHANEQEDRS
jgi:hypothetical protein